MKLTVIAAGAWGTALAITFSARHQVTLWTREEDVTRDMLACRENRRFLPGHPFPESLRVETDFKAAVTDADLLIIAAPLVGFRPTLRALREAGSVKPLLWVCKGLEAETALLPHQVVAQELGEVQCGVLTGPSFAEEVAKGLPLAITLASKDADFARRMALELHSPRFRIYANDDLPGAEVGGAVKNVMAIATGICDGLGFGLNARAALMTRGLAEIARLGVAMGGQPKTFMGLAGMGDLLLTCTGDLSRNRKVGLALAEGKKLSQILADLGHVAEGVSTAREVARLAGRLGIEMPITQAVDAILYGDVPAAVAVEKLLSRDPKSETQ
ncbi:MAG: NAD(P)H-dependent glycerol-3-phosphate dehydrogenase [Propionivibrio sp.]